MRRVSPKCLSSEPSEPKHPHCSPRNEKPRQADPAGVDGGRTALAVGVGGESWMSHQPGSNRLLPLGTGARTHRRPGWTSATKQTCAAYAGPCCRSSAAANAAMGNFNHGSEHHAGGDQRQTATRKTVFSRQMVTPSLPRVDRRKALSVLGFSGDSGQKSYSSRLFISSRSNKTTHKH